MMLQLKKPPFRLRLAPLVHLVRGLFAALQQRQRRRYLTVSAVPVISAIEVPAVPLVEPEPEPIYPSTPEVVPLAETPLVLGDIEPASAIVAPESIDDAQPIDRSRLVTQLLEEATAHGLTTYPQLMDYVKEKTGTSCSKRTISNWKKAKQQAQMNENLSGD